MGWEASGNNVNQVVEKLEACEVPSIEWASRRDLQFNNGMMEVA